MQAVLHKFGIGSASSNQNQAWPFYGFPNRFTSEGARDASILGVTSTTRGLLGAPTVSVPRLAATASDNHGIVLEPRVLPNLGGTGQVRALILQHVLHS